MTREEASGFLKELGELSRKYNTRIFLDGSRDGVPEKIGTIARSNGEFPNGGYTAEYEEYDRFPDAGDLWDLTWDEDAPADGRLTDPT